MIRMQPVCRAMPATLQGEEQGTMLLVMTIIPSALPFTRTSQLVKLRSTQIWPKQRKTLKKNFRQTIMSPILRTVLFHCCVESQTDSSPSSDQIGTQQLTCRMILCVNFFKVGWTGRDKGALPKQLEICFQQIPVLSALLASRWPNQPQWLMLARKVPSNQMPVLTLKWM